jgi:hypothetical protein
MTTTLHPLSVLYDLIRTTHHALTAHDLYGAWCQAQAQLDYDQARMIVSLMIDLVQTMEQQTEGAQARALAIIQSGGLPMTPHRIALATLRYPLVRVRDLLLDMRNRTPRTDVEVSP